MSSILCIRVDSGICTPRVALCSKNFINFAAIAHVYRWLHEGFEGPAENVGQKCNETVRRGLEMTIPHAMVFPVGQIVSYLSVFCTFTLTLTFRFPVESHYGVV